MSIEELEELEKKLEVAKVAYDNAQDAAANARFAATIARDAVYGKENTK